MNRQITITLHVAFWAFLFLSPLAFINYHEEISLVRYLVTCVSLLFMLLVFYVNYLWLIPHYYIQNDSSSIEEFQKAKRRFWLINLGMVVVFGFLMHYWAVISHELFLLPTRQGGYDGFPLVNEVILILRNMFYLMIAATVATAVRMAMRWEQNELMRHDAEAARADAELSNLRSQINPHFLLNTLNNIYALTAFDTEGAQNAIQQLSKMLRHLLYDNQEELVDLGTEVEFLESYVNLMKIRLASNVEVAFSYHPPATPVKVAPLLGISLVENAFKHGVSPTEPSFIHILVTADSWQVVCDIENSNHPKTQSDRSGHGVGLQLVRRRLELAYPGKYEWTHGPSADGTTYRSTIKLNIV